MLINEIRPSYLYEGLTLIETRSVRLWENAGRLLQEAELTPDQINKLFQQVETGATGAGGNRTLLGKGKDAAGAVKKAYDDLVSKVQNSGPVKDVDAMYDSAAEKLKQATGGDTGVMQYVQKYRDFAKAHPVAQSLIYSALIAAAGISGVGIGGAAALGLFKMVDKLLQGEKFSTAAGKGLATGATAFAAGQIGQAMKGPYSGPVDKMGLDPGATGAAQSATSQSYSGTLSGVTGDQIVSHPLYKQIYNQEIANFGNSPMSVQAAKKVASAAVRDAMIKGQQESIVFTGSVLSERQIRVLFSTIQGITLQEGVWDSVKGAAGKAVGAVANKAQQVGKNLTTKVTADKLMGAWKKAGSPTDSEQVKGFLQQQGVDPTLIDPAMQTVGVEPTPAVADPAAATPATPAATPATPAAATTPPTTPTSGGAGLLMSIDEIKSMYATMTDEERTKLSSELDIIDDQDRLSTGTNESKFRRLDALLERMINS